MSIASNCSRYGLGVDKLCRLLVPDSVVPGTDSAAWYRCQSNQATCYYSDSVAKRWCGGMSRVYILLYTTLSKLKTFPWAAQVSFVRIGN